MRLLALLALCALIAALVVPSSILAQDEAPPDTATAPAEPEAEAQPPAEPAAAPVPAEPAPTPEPQLLGDERAYQAAGSKPKAIAAARGSVTIADFNFTPATITINQGDAVTWNNNGPTPHSATANDGSFDTGILRKDQSGSHTFNTAGSFSYYCKPHPFMKGTVVVQAAQTGGGDTSQTGGGDTSGSGSGAAADTGSPAGTGAEASPSDDGLTLPNSGRDSGALLAIGALMLVLGIAVHRRTTTG